MYVYLHKIKLIKKIEVSGRSRGRRCRSEGEEGLVEGDMTRDDAVGGKVKTTVSFVVTRVAKKHIEGRPGSNLVWRGGGEVWITSTAKDAKVIAVWGCTMQGLVWVEKERVLMGWRLKR